MVEGVDNAVLPFQLEGKPLRGRLVRLGDALDQIVKRHAYPPRIGALIGEAVALSLALGSSLKYEGIFTLQIKSDGIVRMLVADVSTDGAIRAYAHYDRDKLLNDEAPLLGGGYLAFTVDQSVTEDRYQGIVPLEGDDLAEAVQHYFRQSEQIPTGIVAASCQAGDGAWRAGALMLQSMPQEGGNAPQRDTAHQDDWLEAMTLMHTCTSQELTDAALPGSILLYRLFHEGGVRVFEPNAFRHECRCSLDRVEAMIKALPPDEVKTLAVDGKIEVTCEFCNRVYLLTN